MTARLAIFILLGRAGLSAAQDIVIYGATPGGIAAAVSAAGAKVRLGRESREEFGEPHAGVVYFDYQTHKFLPGTTGRGDDSLPACTYRLCLTKDPQDAARMTEPPPGYDRKDYLGMLDYKTRPYEIPYRILIPEKIDGLIVPVAASTTHVAFSSIRMEPTWMALGQVAGVAAHLAIHDGGEPRHVPVAELQARLLRQGQVIRHTER